MSEPDAGLNSQPAPELRAGLQDLRRRAEQLQTYQAPSLPAGTAPEVQQLVQDLQVHQIELEMQYEELLLAQTEAEKQRRQYAELYEFAPVGYCTIAPDGTIEQLNLRASQLLGIPRQLALDSQLALVVAPSDRPRCADFLARVLQRGGRQQLQVQLLSRSGTAMYVQLEGTPDATGTRCHLALIDVTQQYQAQQALEIGEKRFRALFEQNRDGILLMRNNHFEDCNDAALRLLGLPDKTALVGQHAAAFAPERQPGGQLSGRQANDCWEQTLRRGHCRFEWCYRHATGEEKWADVLLTAIPTPEPHAMLVHAAWRDITTEKQVALSVKESEEQLQLALNASGSGIWTIDLSTNLVSWDQRAQQIFGRAYSPQAVPFQVVQDAIFPADLDYVAEALRRTTTDLVPFDQEHRIVWPDGTVRHVAAFGKVLHDQPDKQPARFVGLMRDITARRAAEEELGYKNRLLEHILENMPVLLTRLSPTGEYLSVAGSGMQRLGLNGPELVGQNVLEQYPQLADYMRHSLAGETVSFLGSLPRPDGETVHFQNFCFFDAQRQQVICFAIDVTELETGREQLRQEQQFTESVLDNSIDSIMAFDANLCVTAWNRQAARYIGRPAAQALGRPFAEVLALLEADEEMRQLVQRALAGETVQRLNWNGRYFRGTLDLNLAPLLLPQQPNGLLLVAHDVTERNALQTEANRLRQQQQQQVLAAVLATQEEERRRIAEGLHNGVGQLLYATRLHLDQLPASDATNESRRLLNEAIRATRTISFELTPGILKDFGLPMALRELAKQIPAHTLAVDLNLHGLEEPLPSLLQTAIYRMVQEMLNNVMKHAHAREVFVSVARADEHIYVSVEDDGIGFELASTEQHSGIGLAGIRNRVELLGGTLEIHSRAGKGTTLALDLPL